MMSNVIELNQDEITAVTGGKVSRGQIAYWAAAVALSVVCGCFGGSFVSPEMGAIAILGMTAYATYKLITINNKVKSPNKKV